MEEKQLFMLGGLLRIGSGLSTTDQSQGAHEHDADGPCHCKLYVKSMYELRLRRILISGATL